jgi:predicted dehydrogenase
MNKIRAAVIGVGYLGRFHAQKYQSLPDVDLVGLCDTNASRHEMLQSEFSVPVYTHYEDLLDKVDAVSIAAVTQQHYDIAKECLSRGIHVLVEKPITETVEQANKLIALANQNHCVFQVGHLERFNAARLALDNYLANPLFIESQRLSPFNPRGTDVNVVLDLMIHDIDLIHSMIKSPIKTIHAYGTPVLTQGIDIANAHLIFENGTVANVTASRVSFKTLRKMRIFQKENYISVDYHAKELAIFKKGQGELIKGIPNIIQHKETFEQGDALLLEIKAFLHAITTKTAPLISGEDGKEALSVAEKITALIYEHLNMTLRGS